MTEVKDPDVGCTPYERIRRTARRDIDRIFDTWPQAQLDALSRGYPGNRSYDGTPRGNAELTSVEAAATKPDFATAWLAELGDVLLALKLPSRVQPRPGWRKLAQLRAEKFISDWPHNANHVTLRIHRLAEQAAYYWPDPPKTGTVVNNVTVGQRGNDVELCALCHEPAPRGRNPTTGRSLNRTDKDGTTFHDNCYFVVWRQRRATNIALTTPTEPPRIPNM